ncbi:acetyltransferase [Anaerolineae bacterium CFX7]|nr:acetyltransferase [Anaerolineae bacterium CFX7]
MNVSEPKKQHRLVIVGDGETAEIAYEYFTHDSPFEVVAFSVESIYLKRAELFGLPIVPFENLESQFKPSQVQVYVAASSTHLNRVRTRLYRATKAKGYILASYVSSKAFVWHNVEIGENSFIFENNVLQYHVKVGNNVTLWSGNHVGHRTVIHDNVFISSHCVISGFCEIGENCFLGVNSCFNDGVKVARDCVIGSGAVVIRDTEPEKVYVGNPAKLLDKSSFETFKVPEHAR